jgi:hypothetical protein
LDHHDEGYTPEQRAALELVLAFNRRMAEAIDAGLDTGETTRFLDPDPLRYMWVDEGQGTIERVVGAADTMLARSPRLPGHQRGMARVVAGAQHAGRPSVAVGPDGTRLLAWLEWVPDRGDLVQAALLPPGTEPGDAWPDVVSAGVADAFRPTALVSAEGVPWVFYGYRADGRVAVWATSRRDGVWTTPVQVSESDHPAFNQEVVAHADGSVEVVWQGRHKDRFGVFSRTHDGSAWGAQLLVTAGVDVNVWDPTVAGFADGGAAYAWSEYRDGAYRVAWRRRDAAGGLGPVHDLTCGADYALHPHLAVTLDQQLWCAFDLLTIAGHGGSGPTRLRPDAQVGHDPEDAVGHRPAGASVPPELLPEITASVRVLRVTGEGPQEPGEVAAGLNVVPSGLPRLAATADGGLLLAYRVHRQLPLMTYYWEVATQALGAEGWLPPSTYTGTDGPLEEVALAAGPEGGVVVGQSDARLERALQWTEGFGGRECPYLLEHQGAVVWHGVHGVGTVVTADVPAAGPVPAADPPGPGTAVVVGSSRVEARRWTGGERRERYVAQIGERDLTLYWGDLHRHSLVSRCTAGDEPSLEDFYRYAWDVCEYDFWAVTDHSENSSAFQWWSIQKIADLLHVPDRFVPLYGFEWTSADTGHQNVIYGDVARGAPIYSAFAQGTTEPEGLWARLAAHPDFPAITIPHHPGSAMVHNDWDYHDPRFSRLVEVFQACRGSYEADGCFRQYSDGTRVGTFTLDGLRRGHRFGLIASSDHGHGASYVGAFARSLRRADVFEALYQRRTFAATTRDVVVDFRMGEVFMGEAAPPGAERSFTVHAEGYADLARVEVVRDGQVVHSLQPDLGLPEGWVAVPLRVEWGQAEETTRWDGTLQLAAGARVLRTPYWSPEIVAVDDAAVAWRCTTRSFGEPYGSQRGGVELTVVGPPDAVATVAVGPRRASHCLAALLDPAGHEVPGGPGRLRLQPGTGGLPGLGTQVADLAWTDRSIPRADGSFYYARVIQVDGEMAWSSPIWT